MISWLHPYNSEHYEDNWFAAFYYFKYRTEDRYLGTTHSVIPNLFYVKTCLQTPALIESQILDVRSRSRLKIEIQITFTTFFLTRVQSVWSRGSNTMNVAFFWIIFNPDKSRALLNPSEDPKRDWIWSSLLSVQQSTFWAIWHPNR